jgi:hypothetical protein
MRTAESFVGTEISLVELHKRDRNFVQTTCQSLFLRNSHNERKSDRRPRKETGWYKMALVLCHEKLASKRLAENCWKQLVAQKHWQKRSISCKETLSVL